MIGIEDLLGLTGRTSQDDAAVLAPQRDEIDMTIAAKSPRTQSGLLKGGFQVGRTGGNILGLIGDALLVGSGNKAAYGPRLQNQRAAEAVEGFPDDPLGAFNKLGQVDATSREQALRGFNDYQDNERQALMERRLAEAAEAKRKETAMDRIYSMIGVIRPDGSNYSAVKDLVGTYAQRHGVELPTPLPDQFSPEVLDYRKVAIDPDDQVDDERLTETMKRTDADRDAARTNTQNYRQERLKQIDTRESRQASEGNRRMSQADQRIAIAKERASKSGKRGGSDAPPGAKEGQKVKRMVNGKPVYGVVRGGKIVPIN